MKSNIQLRDDEQQVIGFGNYGVYWGEREDALLTRNPSMVTFDPVEDSLYKRADSMSMFSVEERITIPADLALIHM